MEIPKKDVDRIGNYAAMLLADQNIDRRNCRRVVPLEVLSLGYSRTGTMCTFPLVSPCLISGTNSYSQQCKTPSKFSATPTLTTSPAFMATSKTATCGSMLSEQNTMESAPLGEKNSTNCSVTWEQSQTPLALALLLN